MESTSTRPPEACNPAPYGRACAGCSRAKCKCFYRSEGSGCERCHRLGKTCEPSVAVRKRKIRDHEQQPPAPQPAPPPPSSSRLEEKLDDLVSLLRSQAVERQTQSQQQSPVALSTEHNTPSTLTTLVDSSVVWTPVRYPDVEIDVKDNVVHCLRPGDEPNDLPFGTGSSSSVVHDDVSAHQIPEQIANEQLETFRRAFISMFPFVHIPESMTASQLRQQRPFLWLVIMALTTKMVSQQFAMEETIWKIISSRVVSQHLADLDLLLGIICFGSWSHYFKQDKPFMTTLAQLSVSLAVELDLHKDIPTNIRRRKKHGWLAPKPPKPRVRTLEERRTFLAVYHLTSATWTAYRKTEPLRWTSYADDCVRVLSEGQETKLDALLALQAKCHVITNQVTCPPTDDSIDSDSSSRPSSALFTAMLNQLSDIRKGLSDQIRENRITQYYLHSTELIIRESYLSRPKARHHTGFNHFQRLQDLESVLTCVERWLDLFFEMPVIDWPGINMDNFSQFTHCLVALFKLNTLQEEGWDLEEIKRRANVFTILDRACENIESVPILLGMVDAEGPRGGLFFKTTPLLRAIKTLFLQETGSELLPDVMQVPYDNTTGPVEDVPNADDLYLNLAGEPWLADMFTPWDFALGGDNGFSSAQTFEEWL